MKKSITRILSIIIVAGLLMGFSNLDEGLENTKPDASENNPNNNAVIYDGLRNVVETYTERGEITNPSIANVVDAHLRNVERYENEGDLEKAKEHLRSMEDFIETQQKAGNISDRLGIMLRKSIRVTIIQG